jgi:hypothetical protein
MSGFRTDIPTPSIYRIIAPASALISPVTITSNLHCSSLPKCSPN